MENYFKKADKTEIIINSCVAVFMTIINVAASYLGVIGWPMWFVTISFFLMNGDLKKAPHVFVGGTLGIFLSWGLVSGLNFLTPILGPVPAFALLIFIVLFAIIVGGSWVPVAFNNIAFAYLTVATVTLTQKANGLALHPTMTNIQVVIDELLVLFVGGAIILGGALLFIKIGTKIASKVVRTA
ncbi:MAG: hypothetical protein LBV67_06775 [Streptococcaceae bacterium]|jgi:hypothetical protein|nr:hypothetical protein [Streptococcaceae bacterium]